MGHATHFLQRLDRVSDRHVETALALYRDDDLLKSVLSSVPLPDGCERLAVSLEHPTEGPFVVLTRGGQFVTCLAAGMRADNLPIVSRERFDLAAARVQRMRDELDRIRQASEAEADGQVARIMKNLQSQCGRFCREDAAIVARVQPLLALWFCKALAKLARMVQDDAPRIAVLRFDRLKPLEHEYIELFGRAVWSTAHLLPFIGCPEARGLLGARFGERLSTTGAACAQLTFDWGTVPFAQRALWTVAHSGKEGLHAIRKLPKQGGDLLGRLFRELSLGAIVASSSKLRAEAHKAMCTTPVQPTDHSPAALTEWLIHTAGRAIEGYVTSEPDERIAAEAHRGRTYIRDVLALDPAVDISDDIAIAALLNAPVSWLGPEIIEIGANLALAFPWLARARVDQLFLPRAWADRLTVAPSFNEVESWFKPYRTVCLRGRPTTHVRTAPKVGRNDPCGCGSGRKAKHCCVAAAGVREA